MLPVEGDRNNESGARRYLSVTDFAGGREHTEPSAHSYERGANGEKKGPSDEDSGNAEGQEEEQEEDEEQQGRTSRLDPLWEGLGSLGERLAGVDDRFDQLDQEICHDHEASTFALLRTLWVTTVVPILYGVYVGVLITAV